MRLLRLSTLFFLLVPFCSPPVYSQDLSSNTLGPGSTTHLTADSATIMRLVDSAMISTRTNMLEAKVFAEMAFDLANRQDDQVLRFIAARAVGNVQIMMGNYAEALIFYENQLQSMDGEFRKAHPREVMMIVNNTAGTYSYLGDFEAAIDGFSTALEIAIELKDSLNEGKCLQNLGSCFSDLGKYQEANDFFNRSLKLKIAMNDSASIPSTYLALSEIALLDQNDADLAFQYVDQAERISRSLGDSGQLGNALYKRATHYMSQGSYERAEEELSQAFVIAKAAKYEVLEATILSVLGNCRVQTGDYANARKALMRSLEMAENQNRLDIQEYVHYWLSRAHELEGNSVAALEAFKAFESAKDSLHSMEAEGAAAKFQARYKVKQYQKDLLLSNQEKEQAVSDRNRILLIGGMLGLFGLIIGWREVRLQRNRKILLQTKLALQEKELVLGRQKLDTFADRLREKNLLIDELESKLREAPKDEIAFDKLLQMKILTDEDWKQFQILFSQAHPNFIGKLRRKHPELTTGEQRLVLLLRLNMTNKEVADILGVSGQAVKVARHRLRKKVGLSSSESLSDFVAGLD